MTRFELGRRPVGRRGTIAAAVAFLGLSGFPRQASAFFSAPSCLSATRRGTREVLDVLDVRTCRERPTGAVVSAAARGRMRTRMSTAEPATDQELPEMLPPPDREQALKIVKAMEAKTRGKGADDDLGAYATALIPAMPEPPYFFKVPGEFGNDTLCTDPAWHLALTALTWMGCPYELEHDEEEDEPNFLLGDQEYDDPVDFLATLPERCMLCDFVETLPRIAKHVSKVQPAWLALYLNTDKSKKKKVELEKDLDGILKRVDTVLKSATGDLLEGDEMTAGDLELAVTTYHMMAAFGTEKKWEFPKRFPDLHQHMAAMHGMMCFKTVMPAMEDLAQRYKAMKK